MTTSAQTVRKPAGTVGLILAQRLYGEDAVRSIGNYYQPGEVEIPAADEVAFDELVDETLKR